MPKQKLPSTAVGRRRLLKLADLLEADAKNKKGIKFDLGLWGRVNDVSYDDKPKVTTVDCGTTACAIGLACISGVFKKGGLSARLTTGAGNGGNHILPVYGRRNGFNAVETFFAITSRASKFLFTDADYPETTGAKGERAVAKRIRDFVSGKIAPPVPPDHGW